MPCADPQSLSFEGTIYTETVFNEALIRSTQVETAATSQFPHKYEGLDNHFSVDQGLEIISAFFFSFSH